MRKSKLWIRNRALASSVLAAVSPAVVATAAEVTPDRLINADKEYIVTTVQKAKELRPFVEKCITLARRAENLTGDETAAQAVHLRRQASRFFHAGNTNFKREQSRFRGKKGEPKDKIERTAGVKAVQRLFDELGARYKDRNGGYTRIIKLSRRSGDNAEVAVIELVDNAREMAAKG